MEIPVGRATIVLKAKYTQDAVERAKRRPGNHNQRRSAVGRELAARLAAEYGERFTKDGSRDGSEEVSNETELAEAIRATPQFKEALQRVWPRITGQELVHDLLGAPALLRAAGKGILSDREIEMLYRPRFTSTEEIAWTKADAALIDEARVLVGPRKRPRPAPRPTDNVLAGVDLDAYSGDHRAAALREAQRLAVAQSQELDEAEFVTYGHIVVDEAQDLSPMELRVLKRRDLTGSMTIVGDMGQATTASSSASWDTLLNVLAPRREPTRVDLTVSYRTPQEVLAFAAPTLLAAAPDLVPPRPVRRAGSTPLVVLSSEAEFADTLVQLTRGEIEAVAPGRLAVIVTRRRVNEIVDDAARRWPRSGGSERPRLQGTGGRPGGPRRRRCERIGVRRRRRCRAWSDCQSRGSERDHVHATRIAHPVRRAHASHQATRRHRHKGSSADPWLRAQTPSIDKVGSRFLLEMMA